MSADYFTRVRSLHISGVAPINRALAQLDAAIQAASVAAAGYTAAVVYDSKATTTDGGSSTGSSWVQRNLNQETDPDSIVAVASNRFTPIAGTYLVIAIAPGFDVGNHKIRLVNYTDSETVIATGQNADSDGSQSMTGNAHLAAIVTANGTDAYQIEHWTTTTNADDGFGLAVDDGTVEIYTQVLLLKLP